MGCFVNGKIVLYSLKEDQYTFFFLSMLFFPIISTIVVTKMVIQLSCHVIQLTNMKYDQESHLISVYET